jgi:uncharacterized protein (TIGR02594 family)
MSDFRITGNPNPVVGKEEFYTINAFFGSLLPNPLIPKSSFGPPVSWAIYILENGKWRKTKENDKRGDKVSYTFLQKSLERKGIRILATRGEQVARLDIKTQAAGSPKIDSVELLDKSGKKPAKPLSYGQTLKARVHCLHMEKRKVYVTLWEDDAKKGGHNTANEKNIIETRFGIVKNGKADIDFPLRPSFAKIATKAGPEKDKIHEYYVTTEFNKEKIPSKNVNVNELEAPVAPFKGKTTSPGQTQPVKNNVPVQKPKTPTQTVPVQTKVKGVINSVNITDANGNKIKGVFKENRIKVWINSKGLIGKEVRLKLYDEDILSNDELLDQKFTIKSDLHVRLVPLDTIPRSLGGDFGEGPELELFAYVEVLLSGVNKPSEIVNVDATVFKPDPIEPSKSVFKQGKNDKKDEKKDEKKGGCENCIAPVTAGQLKKIFTKADPAVLEKVAKTYTKYMKELGMDTCWNKAHFFAQAVVESGKELLVSGKGESMNYLADDLYLGRWNKNKTRRDIIFSYFKTHKEEAYKYGRIEEIKNGKRVVTQSANEEMIANLAYGPNAAKGKELGNTESSDGWNLRGRGLVQLTGRSGYEYANTYTKREGADIIKNSDLIVTNASIAVLSSMAFWKWKKIAPIANSNKNTKNICKKVGKNVTLANGKNNYDEKQSAFADITSVTFEINKCKYGKVEKTILSGKAPWMPFALKEIGQKAILGNDNNSRITEYFTASTNGKGLNEGTNWCGAFASWCFTQAGYTPPPLSCRAAMWQFWKQDKPIYGSAAVIDWDSNQSAKANGKDGAVGGAGHITFVVGISADGNHYYCVGGNQGGVKGARTVKISKYSKNDIDWFVIPPDYVPSKNEYTLKVMNNEADVDSASTTRT